MKKSVYLQLSDKASDNLIQLSKKLGVSHDEFATLCFEHVDIKQREIIDAAKKIRDLRNSESCHEKNLSQYLQQLSAEQIKLLLNEAAKKKKN